MLAIRRTPPRPTRSIPVAMPARTARQADTSVPPGASQQATPATSGVVVTRPYAAVYAWMPPSTRGSTRTRRPASGSSNVIIG
jgi:hypothetical protein